MLVLCLAACHAPWVEAAAEDGHFGGAIRPLLERFCISCHSTDDQKGDLDLERFGDMAAVERDAGVWELVEEQVALGEMPPEKEEQPTAAQKEELLAWVRETLRKIARANAGDPGPVVVRRLSNAEYTHTLRDLTGVGSLDPAREFPADGAAGEGFTNAGAALVMSPALLTKYLDAAKTVADHAVLVPDGIAFSEKTTQRDWTEEKLAAIREFYARFTEIGGGTSVDLQGIRFDTQDGGVLPLERYFEATIAGRAGLESGRVSIAHLAHDRGLNPKYLGTLWEMLNGTGRSAVLDTVRDQWRHATPDDVPDLAATVRGWQGMLWRFTTVGHIGKRDGPEAWQEPVSPLASATEIRLELPATSGGEDVTLSLVTSSMGTGEGGGTAVWERPRLISGNRTPVPLRDVGALDERIATVMERELGRTGTYLECLEESHATGQPVEELASARGLDAAVAANWSTLVDLGHRAGTQVLGRFAERISSDAAGGAIRGWGSDDTPSLLTNRSGEPVTLSTLTIPGRGVTVHPSPTQEATVIWRSPTDGEIRAGGLVADADGNCGNGVAWRLEVVGREGTTELASGTLDNGGREVIKPEGAFAVRSGDLVKLAVNPREGNHACDTTHVALTLTETAPDSRIWDLATDIIDQIHDANPLPDSHGNADVWHFAASGEAAPEPDLVPPGSALAAWREAVEDGRTGTDLAAAVQRLLTGLPDPRSDADATLRARLLDWDGPLGWLKTALDGLAQAAGPADIEVTAPSVLTFRIPARLAAGAEFVATGRVRHDGDGGDGGGGGVQMRISLDPDPAPGLSPAAPIVVGERGAARERIMADLDAFRQVFPAALCYTKIVPVDEVVTLTLFYREDHHLRRLLLDDREAAEIDRLWDELRFVSEDALKLVDVFEQLWQYATQDGDPTTFEPMREPILQGAAAFRDRRAAAEPAHLAAVVGLAARAWRRPLAAAEADSLRAFYAGLRAGELAHDEAIRLTLARVLVAPAFLYKLETPPPTTAPAPVSATELATRLSYFLWSSAPDAELAALAADGTLRDPDVLAAQARRMLGDARVRRLATEFGSQWLHVRDFDQLDEKSARHFPEFAGVRGALHEEPIRFFTDHFQNDRPVLELLDADHAFVDGTLANHYEIGDPEEAGWRRVDGMRALGRGGVLGFGATLAKQSGASRTSPVLRGNWISETLLGERLPRPPSGVPVLPEEPPPGLTERQLTAQHSSDPSCARCHDRIDPLGFSLENFDGIGRFRTEDAAGHPVDARARTVDGVELEGIDGLRRYLLTQRRDDFLRQFCRKLVGFALGRGVLLSDAPLLDAMVGRLQAGDGRVGLAVEMVVRSPQFREIRGRDFPAMD
ncbi:hypothetical protein BH23VER1_BH23VER1_11840 [soil metagenome]